MAQHVRHEPCPECRKNGNDRKGNNLSVYSDGGVHCWNCGFHRNGDSLQEFKTKTSSGTGEPTKSLILPRDVDFQLPQKARDYLRKYSLTPRQIHDNHIMWSDYYQRLIFPYFDDTGLLAWQGRYLGEEENKAKWFSQGDLKQILHILHPAQKSDTIILVEDVISAIRVSQFADCMPLFGSFISTTMMLRLAKRYGIILVWLDKDKEKDSYKFSKQLRDLGRISHSVVTDLDPKELNNEQISRAIYGGKDQAT